MSVASLLLKPNAISRAVTEDSNSALMQDAFSLMVRILLDRTGKNSDLSLILEKTVLRSFSRIQTRIGDNFRSAGERLFAMIEPLLARITGEQGWPQGETAEQFNYVLDLIAQGAQKIQDIQIGDLRGPIRDCFTIVVDDLGLTPDFLDELVRAFFTDLSDSLEQRAQGGEGDARKNAQALAQLIRRIRRKIPNRLQLPDFNADLIATAFMKLLRKFDIEKAMDAVKHGSAALAEVIEAVDAILDLVPFSGQSTQSIGASHAEEEETDRDYCWYLSWLLGDRYAHRPGWSRVVHGLTSIFNPSPADEIWAQGTTSDFVRHYLFHREQRLYNAGYADQQSGNETYKMFEFDSEATAAAAAALAGLEAVRHVSDTAQRWVNNQADRDEFEEAVTSAADIWEEATDFANAANDLAREAQAKSAGCNTVAMDVRAAAEAAKNSGDSANASSGSAFDQWIQANRVESQSGRSQVATAVQKLHDLVDLTVRAAQQAATAAQNAQTSFDKASLAATKISTAHNNIAVDVPDFASTALTAAQTTLTAAGEASTAANEASAQAALALAAANETLTLARRAKTLAKQTEDAAEQAEDALDEAHDAVEDTAIGTVYQAVLNAFGNVENAAERASEAADTAADAALLARAAAVAVASRPRYAFKHITPETMEGWARHTSSFADLVEGFFHGISIERGDFLSNLLLTVYTATSAIYKWGADRPIPQWVEWVSRFLSPFLGCFPYMHYNTEGASKNRTIFWFTYYGKRLIEAHMYYLLAHGARSALLSILTLANHDQDIEENKPLNFEAIEGFTQLIAGPFIFLWAALTPIDHYAAEQKENDWKLYWLDWVIGGIVYTLLSNTVGFLGGIAIARAWSAWDSGWQGMALWANQMWKTFILSILGYFPALFIIWENETEEGHIGHDAVYRPFITGYPERESSPYLLPFDDGPIQCAQGNMGIWSHHVYSYNYQVYAYDFANDFGDRILASRAGTVVDFFDWAPDNEDIFTSEIEDPVIVGNTLNLDTDNNPDTGLPFTVDGQTVEHNWNFVCIRHDHDPAHDPMDMFNNPVPTYLIYGHGQNGTVREAFNSQEPIDIIGQEVPQGRFIMHSDDTGVSAYNHLHTHLVPGPPDFLDHNKNIVAGGAKVDGVTLSFTDTLGGTPIRPCSVYITFDRVVVARDNGIGRFSGHYIDEYAATIDYASGAITVAWIVGKAPRKDVGIRAYYDEVLMIDTADGAIEVFDNGGAYYDLTITAAGRLDRIPTPGSVVILLDGVPVAQDDNANHFVTTLDTAASMIDYNNGLATIAWIPGHAPPSQVEIGIPFDDTHSVGVGNNSVIEFQSTLPYTPIIPETLHVRLNSVTMLVDDWFDGMLTTLDTGACSINLNSGNIAIAWQTDYPPPAGVTINARYGSTHHIGTAIGLGTFQTAIPNPPVTGRSMIVQQSGVNILTDDGIDKFENTLNTNDCAFNIYTGLFTIAWKHGHAPPANVNITARYDSTHRVGEGDGVNSAFSTVLPHTSVTEGSVVILINGIQAAVENGSHDSFTGANVNSTASSINHSTGQLAIVWDAGSEPADHAVITARFSSTYAIGMGDNSTLSFTQTLPNASIVAGSVVIRLGNADIALDSGNRFISCIDIANSIITHSTGDLTIIWLADHEPPAGASIDARYESIRLIGVGAVGTTSFNTILGNPPIHPGTVIVEADGAAVAMESAGANSLVPILSPDLSSIDYATGELKLTWNADHPPTSGVSISADYNWRHHVGTGDNATLSFTTTIPNTPLTPGTIFIQLNDRFAAVDDSHNNFTTHVNGAASHIDYFSGELNVEWDAGFPPGDGAVITADYETTDQIGTGTGPAGINFGGRFTRTPVRRGSITIQLDWVNMATDNGTGSFTGNDIDTAASAINYWDGTFTLAWTAGNGPPAGAHILAVYHTVVPMKSSDLHPYTMPFVYRDVDHSSIYNQKKDGIPRSLSYYNSDNTEP